MTARISQRLTAGPGSKSEPKLAAYQGHVLYHVIEIAILGIELLNSMVLISLLV